MEAYQKLSGENFWEPKLTDGYFTAIFNLDRSDAMSGMVFGYDLDTKLMAKENRTKKDIMLLHQNVRTALRWASFKPWNYKNTYFSSYAYASEQDAAQSLIKSIKEHSAELMKFARYIEIRKVGDEFDVLHEMGNLSSKGEERPSDATQQTPNADKTLPVAEKDASEDDDEDNHFHS